MGALWARLSVVALTIAGGVDAWAQPAAPPLPPTRPRVAVVTAPDWASRPSAADVARVYPEHAQRLEKSGRVRLICKVAADGALENCRVASETPEGLGFGEAAMKLVPSFKMRSTTRDGEPVEGSTVNIPIVFNLSEPVPDAPQVRPPVVANPGQDLIGRPGVRLSCTVRDGGSLEDCRIMSETPAPKSEAATVDIPIIFRND